jgi:outer membrane protein OmpA-like peptidoglycan-associated protein
MTRAALLALLLALASCAGPRERVVLLPGGTAPLTITTRQGRSLTLDTAYQTAEARPSGRLDAGLTTAALVEARYGAVLASWPRAGRLFTLHFTSGDITLTDASEAEVPALLQEVARRGAVEVEITGHTDTVGEADSNDALSLARADAVRVLLIAQGLQATFVRVVGRGERDLAVPTPDETDEPGNRRVEVLVR